MQWWPQGTVVEKSNLKIVYISLAALSQTCMVHAGMLPTCSRIAQETIYISCSLLSAAKKLRFLECYKGYGFALATVLM